MISLNILFANDDVLTQWLMSEVLSGVGFTVTSVCRGTQVIDLLAEAPDYDILVIDAGLPDISDGCDVVRHWRRALPGRPIVFTGPARGVLQPLHLSESFLRAPFSADALLRAVDMALEDACFRPVLPTVAAVAHHIH